MSTVSQPSYTSCLTLSLSFLPWRDSLSPERSVHASSRSRAEFNQSVKSWAASWYSWWSCTASSCLSKILLEVSQTLAYFCFCSETNLFTYSRSRWCHLKFDKISSWHDSYIFFYFIENSTILTGTNNQLWLKLIKERMRLVPHWKFL